MPNAVRVIDDHAELVNVTTDQHHARSHDHATAGDGTALVPVSLAVSAGPVAYQGDISPAQITADQNDYDPAGLSTAAVLRLSTDAPRTVTGLAGGADGRMLLVVNIGAFNLVLADESGLSIAGNRFALAAAFTLLPDTGAVLLYDSTSSRWRMVAMGVAGGEGATFTGNKTITGTLTVQTGPLTLSAGQLLIPDGTQAVPGLAFANSPGTGLNWAPSTLRFSYGGLWEFLIGPNQIWLYSNTASLNWGNSQDLRLTRDAANDLAQRNGATAQKHSLYGTYTSSTVYERLRFLTALGDYSIAPEAAGGGTLRGLILGGSGGRLGFYGVAAISRAVLATGVGATVDNVITALQNLGLVSQT